MRVHPIGLDLTLAFASCVVCEALPETMAARIT